MNNYHFTVVVRDARSDLSVLEDKFFEAGCDDALVCSYNDTIYLEFDREATAAKNAITSAFNDLKQAGFNDLILQEKGVSSLSEMAKRLGVSRTTLSNYAHAKRGNGDFPKPVYGVLSGSALYAWHEVAGWLYHQNKIPKTDYNIAKAAIAF